MPRKRPSVTSQRPWARPLRSFSLHPENRRQPSRCSDKSYRLRLARRRRTLGERSPDCSRCWAMRRHARRQLKSCVRSLIGSKSIPGRSVAIARLVPQFESIESLRDQVYREWPVCFSSTDAELMASSAGHAPAGAETVPKLTLPTDHLVGTDQWGGCASSHSWQPVRCIKEDDHGDYHHCYGDHYVSVSVGPFEHSLSSLPF